MGLPQIETNVKARMVARMKGSSLLTNTQRAASQWSKFEAANKMRSHNVAAQRDGTGNCRSILAGECGS